MSRQAPRILIVNRPGEGGAFEHVSTLDRALVKAGFEVAICGPLAHRAAELAGEVIQVNITRRPSPTADARSIVELARTLRWFRPDLIHAHGSKGGVMARAARTVRLRTPLVHTPHGYAFAGYQTSQVHRRTYRVIERSLSPLANRVLCVCEAEAHLASEVCDPAKVRVVHNGIRPPVEPIESMTLDGVGDGPVVSAISGLRPGKGLETLIEALPQVLNAVPGVQVILAGDGDERDRLQGLAETLGVAASLRMIGNVREPYSVLAASDVFVNPSWAESFPYTILEAMAARMPIVATNVGGVGEAVENELTGLLVPPRDPAALAEGVLRLLSNQVLALRLGDAARQRLEERFSVTKMINGIFDVYRELGIEPP